MDTGTSLMLENNRRMLAKCWETLFVTCNSITLKPCLRVQMKDWWKLVVTQRIPKEEISEARFYIQFRN